MNDQALKDRLKIIAQERGMDFNQLWRLFLLERFLARLSKSKVQDRFVFKGGLLLSSYIKIGRETVDADFLAKKIKLQTQELKNAIEEIISIKTADLIKVLVESYVCDCSPSVCSHPHLRQRNRLKMLTFPNCSAKAWELEE